jgi:SAM-dependent methyltransferase
MLEIGPGHGSLARAAVAAGWRYHGVEASRVLADELTREGLNIVHAWTPPIPANDASADVVYADQVLEHMSGIDAAREFVAEARRILRSKGVLFVVVPDYLKERQFFWDIDYTHNFITTERRVAVLYDGGFDITRREASAAGPHAMRWRLARCSPTYPGWTPSPLYKNRVCCSACARTCSRHWRFPGGQS